jgi:hypothetical protein
MQLMDAHARAARATMKSGGRPAQAGSAEEVDQEGVQLLYNTVFPACHAQQ